jgi:hypothetical protein
MNSSAGQSAISNQINNPQSAIASIRNPQSAIRNPQFVPRLYAGSMQTSPVSAALSAWLVYVEDRHEATVGGGFALAVVRAFWSAASLLLGVGAARPRARGDTSTGSVSPWIPPGR